MGSQTRRWSRHAFIITHGHTVVVPRGEVPFWTKWGRIPLSTALASALERGGATSPSISQLHHSLAGAGATPKV
ncbi:hypothetical protein A4X13_0g2415 [Tilletia indica]|uniref:Uncharacterized protein n=1 Tax=Tilletia indica TaxID=43049 RepID=A0A177TT57_9BASI|nr:hypothetical protein A4X13_0g2415 [Tilletia indica]